MTIDKAGDPVRVRACRDEHTGETNMTIRNTSLRRAVARAAAASAMLTAITFGSASVLAASTPSPDRVEARIKEMHATLKIAAGQEDQWTAVAQVMRDNETAIEPLVKERQAGAKTMTAVDDLKSYSAISRAHADATEKFTTAFEPLYAVMTDDQKKEADDLFRHGMRKAVKGK
jgi:hypothetical protein